ncbi:MAG: carbon storage regulator [Planctomycetaceae bacterium]
MLVLTRKTEESIHIGSNITIQVVSVKGNRVRIAIDAPPEVLIKRAELGEQRELQEELLLASC